MAIWPATMFRRKIDGPDDGFIPATLTAFTTRSRHNKLPLERVLLIMVSLEPVQKIRNHQFLDQLIRTSKDAGLPEDVLERAAVARQKLHAVFSWNASSQTFQWQGGGNPKASALPVRKSGPGRSEGVSRSRPRRVKDTRDCRGAFDFYRRGRGR